MIEPDLKYCPQCRDEYRAEIEMCASCNLPLVLGGVLLEKERTKHERRARMAPLTLHDDVVPIHKASAQEIKHLQDVLQKEHIGSLRTADESSCGKGCCAPSFYLNVLRTDVVDALALMEAEYRRTTGLDSHYTELATAVFNPEATEAVCPACGFSFSTSTTTCPDCGLCFG